MSAYSKLFEFVDYVWSFYGTEDPLYPIKGLTKKHIFDAIFIYRDKIIEAEKTGNPYYSWGDGFEFFDLKSEYYYLLFNKEEDF